jgi:hypothetical protein
MSDATSRDEPARSHVSRRGRDVEFLSERYHRSFDEEAATIAALLAQSGDAEVSARFDALRGQLRRHEELQERHLFPAYQTFTTMSGATFAAWIDDSAALAAATRQLRDAAAASSLRPALRQRVAHFVSEVERHLVDEAELLTEWTAGAGCLQ